jgi:hypothetical protein
MDVMTASSTQPWPYEFALDEKGVGLEADGSLPVDPKTARVIDAARAYLRLVLSPADQQRLDQLISQIPMRPQS